MRIVRSVALALVATLSLLIGAATIAGADPSPVAAPGAVVVRPTADPEDPGIPPSP
jgi:hypothetical protein